MCIGIFSLNVNDLTHVQCFPRAPNWSWIFRTRLVTRVCWLKTIRLYCCSCHVLPATCRTSTGNQKLPANERLLPSCVRWVYWPETCELIITSQKADNHLLFFKNHFLFWGKKMCINHPKANSDWLDELWPLNLIFLFPFLLWFLNKIILSMLCLCFVNMVFCCCVRVCLMGLLFNNLDKNRTASHWNVGETCFYYLVEVALQYYVQRIWGPFQFLWSKLHYCLNAGRLIWWACCIFIQSWGKVLTYCWFQMLQLLHPSCSTPTSSQTRPRRLWLLAPPLNSAAVDQDQSSGQQRHSTSCTRTNWGTRWRLKGPTQDTLGRTPVVMLIRAWVTSTSGFIFMWTVGPTKATPLQLLINRGWALAL